MGTAELAQQERAAICDLFVELGPAAPTLCEGWTTADLAAHLLARERRPDSGPGLVWPPLARHTDKVRTSLRDRLPWERLVDLVRTGPPVWLRPFDGPMNTVEFFVHTEDVRRARPGFEPRPLSAAMADALWARVGPGTMARKVGATVALVSVGRAPKVAGSGPRLELRGDPGELTLFATGRQRAASVDVGGEPALAEALRSARLGI
ncbi:MAG TPA: TIGR03085 family metal-binding protein [Acidimicrobiales bacterium]|nr:TIGR03085 family metal-binding protein [Acidimicrobiales bacterium]